MQPRLQALSVFEKLGEPWDKTSVHVRCVCGCLCVYNTCILLCMLVIVVKIISTPCCLLLHVCTVWSVMLCTCTCVSNISTHKNSHFKAHVRSSQGQAIYQLSDIIESRTCGLDEFDRNRGHGQLSLAFKSVVILHLHPIHRKRSGGVPLLGVAKHDRKWWTGVSYQCMYLWQC